MPMVTSGQLRVTNGTTTPSNAATDAAANYWAGRAGGTVAEKSNLNWYRGRRFYYNASGGTVRSNEISMSYFYGSSPVDEWNCACDCICGGK